MRHKPFLCPYAIIFPVILLAGLSGYLFKAGSCPLGPANASDTPASIPRDANGLKPVPSTDEEWHQALSAAQYQVCRLGDTEPEFSGAYCTLTTPGTYRCAACGQGLFDSTAKFDSGKGWPSFHEPLSDEHLMVIEGCGCSDETGAELVCARCGACLGKRYATGDEDGGYVYIVNSLALALDERK